MTTAQQPSALALVVPSLVGGLVGLFVGDVISDFAPTSKVWGIVAKSIGLGAGALAGMLVTPLLIPGASPSVPAIPTE